VRTCPAGSTQDTTIISEPYLSAKEPYLSAKEPYLSAKEPYLSTKDPCLPAKEPDISEEEPNLSAKANGRHDDILRTLSSAKEPYISAHEHIFLLKSPISLQKSPISAKKPYLSKTETYIPTKEQYLSVEEPCVYLPSKVNGRYINAHSYPSTTNETTFPQKSPIISLHKRTQSFRKRAQDPYLSTKEPYRIPPQ